MSKILTTSYIGPDLDGTACSIAYAEYLNKKGIDSVAGILEEMHDEAKYIFEKFDFTKPLYIENDSSFEEVVLLDASEINGILGKIDPNKVIEIIDHRKLNDVSNFPNAKVQIELVGSAATLVAEKFIKENIDITKESATLLYCAIISNTLNFRASITTDRDKLAFDWLKKYVDLDEDFWKELFIAKSDLSGNKLFDRINNELAVFDIQGKKLSIIQLEIYDSEDLVKNRKQEIISKMKDIKDKYNLDIIFTTIIDLKNVKNIFISYDGESQKILSMIFNLEFKDDYATRQGLILRKQITPLIKEYLEN